MEKMGRLWYVFVLGLLLVTACQPAAPTEEASDTLYFVDTYTIDEEFDIYHIDDAWQRDVEDECKNGFPIPRVASHETVIKIADGEIKVKLEIGKAATIEVPPGLIPESEWNTTWHGGVLEPNKELAIALVNGDTKYTSIANCALNLMSD